MDNFTFHYLRIKTVVETPVLLNQHKGSAIRGALYHALRGPSRSINQVAWFSGGSRIATAGYSGHIQVWDLRHIGHTGVQAYGLALADTGMRVEGFRIVDLNQAEWGRVKAIAAKFREKAEKEE